MSQAAGDLNKYLCLISSGKPSASGHTPLRLVICAFAAFFLGYMAIPAAGTVFFSGKNILMGIFAICGPLTSLLALFIMVRCYTGSMRKTMLHLGFRRFPWKMLLLGLPLSIGIMLCSGTITFTWQQSAELMKWDLGTSPTLQAAFSDNIWDVAALIMTALVAAPLFEEIFFRRTIYGALLKLLPHSGAALITSLVFSAIHLSLLQLPGLFFIGFVWQHFYIGSRSLWTSVILHFFNNLLATVMLISVRLSGFTDI